MAVSPTSSSSLELTISMPGFSSSLSLPSTGDQGVCAIVRDLDINQIPSGAGEEEEEEEQEEWMTAAMVAEEGSTINGGTTASRKKLRLSKEQSRLLEESFRQHPTLNPRKKEALALQLKLTSRQVEVWFQNRRARSKLKQTEMECEYLKRWFGSLTEQNRRLQREVEELKAIKVGPPTVISPHNCETLPASTLTMCPRCKRVTTTAATVAYDQGPTKIAAAAATAATATAVALFSNVGMRQPSAA